MSADVHEMRLRYAAPLACFAMIVADLAGTAIVISENHYEALLSMVLDEVCWLAGLACAVLGTGDLIRERRITKRVVVLGLAISIGNLAGTWIGVAVLGRLIAAG